MSYSWHSGYDQHICKNGHQFNTEHLGDDEDDRAWCPYCEEPSVWYNLVDCTTGWNQGVIEDFSSLLIEPEKRETCECCGNTKVIAQARFRLPTLAEKKALRKWFDE